MGERNFCYCERPRRLLTGVVAFLTRQSVAGLKTEGRHV
jgi:hypothetical protein